MFPTIAEYNQTIQKNGDNAFVTLKGLTFIPSRTVPVKIFSYGAGSYAVIFKSKDAFNMYAIRCFISGEPAAIGRYKEISDYLNNIHASWITNFSLLENEINVNGQNYPILKMDWVNGKLLNDYIDEILPNNHLLTVLQEEIVVLSKSLEKDEIGHGDIQCGNIIMQNDVANKPLIRLIDYDGMYIPAFKNRINLEKGRTEFQHPQRAIADFNEQIDRFSFWVILCALEALKFDKSLWLPVMQGGYNTLDNMLFVGNDFTNFSSSKLVSRLYNLNQPSLSFYLNKLNKFCHSTPASIEAPILYSPIEPKVVIPFEIKVEKIVPEKPVELVEIVSNPPEADVFTANNQYLGVTPLQLDKRTYLNQKLLVNYDARCTYILIGKSDTKINVCLLPENSSVQKKEDLNKSDNNEVREALLGKNSSTKSIVTQGTDDNEATSTLFTKELILVIIIMVSSLICLGIFYSFTNKQTELLNNQSVHREDTKATEPVENEACCNQIFSDYQFAVKCPAILQDVSMQSNNDFDFNYAGNTDDAFYQIMIIKIPAGRLDLSSEEEKAFLRELFGSQGGGKSVLWGEENLPAYLLNDYTQNGYRGKGIAVARKGRIFTFNVMAKGDLDAKFNSFTNSVFFLDELEVKMGTYTKRGFGSFRIDYPQSWEVLDNPNQYACVFIRAPKNIHNESVANFNVIISRDETSLEAKFLATQKQCRDNIPEYALLSKNYTSIDGMQCLQTLAKSKIQGVNFNTIGYQFKKPDNTTYTITFTVHSESYDEYIALFEQIIQSFKLI